MVRGVGASCVRVASLKKQALWVVAGVLCLSKRYLSREDLKGKEVIDLEASRVGFVRDLVLDVETKGLYLAVARDVEAGVEEQKYFPGDKIERIRDVILVKSAQTKPS